MIIWTLALIIKKKKKWERWKKEKKESKSQESHDVKDRHPPAKKKIQSHKRENKRRKKERVWKHGAF